MARFLFIFATIAVITFVCLILAYQFAYLIIACLTIGTPIVLGLWFIARKDSKERRTYAKT